MKIKDLYKTFKAEIDGVEFELLESMSYGVQKQIRESTDDDKDIGLLIVSTILKGWNLTDDEGDALPVNEETILSLPMSALTKIIDVFNTQANKKKE